MMKIPVPGTTQGRGSPHLCVRDRALLLLAPVGPEDTD